MRAARTTVGLLMSVGLALGATSLGACASSAKKTHDLLYDIRGYNEGIRWNKLPQAAVRVHPKEREAFMDEREELEEELRVDDVEITRLKMENDGDMARVQVKWMWHMDREGIVKNTTTRQHWKRYGKRWILLQELHVKGDEMPGVALAQEESEEELVQGAEETDKSPVDSGSSSGAVGALRARD